MQVKPPMPKRQKDLIKGIDPAVMAVGVLSASIEHKAKILLKLAWVNVLLNIANIAMWVWFHSLWAN